MNYDQITENLYVGGWFDDWKPLAKLGLTVNLNMQSEHQDIFDGSYPEVSLWLPTRDWFGPNPEAIEQGASFIKLMIDGGHKVYVHCRHGAGRAPIVAAGYMVMTGMDVEEAIQFVKAKRPGFKANGGQFKNLRKFAKKWNTRQQT